MVLHNLVVLGFAASVLPQACDVDLQNLDPKLFRLLSEQAVTDVLLDGARDCWIDRGRGLESRPSPFGSENEATATAIELARQDQVRLDLSKPFADVVASHDGSGIAVRIHLVLASEICDRTQICLRVFADRPVILDQLVGLGMLSLEQAELLRQISKNRQNFLISGATGSGKTTLLRAIASEFSTERVITIEDIPELRLSGNCLTLLTRQPNQEGRGAISADDLLIQSLRMRPDRILLGELRGPELASLLRVLNTGHGGVGATIHANYPESVWSRLQGMAQLAGLQRRDLDSAASGVLDWVIHCERSGAQRRVVSISRLSHPDLTGSRTAADSTLKSQESGRRRRLEVC